MPFFIQYLKEYTTKIDAVQNETAQVKEKHEKMAEAQQQMQVCVIVIPNLSVSD